MNSITKPQPQTPSMTPSQRAAMIAFHERAARAYEASGQTEQAQRARDLAAKLKAEQTEQERNR